MLFKQMKARNKLLMPGHVFWRKEMGSQFRSHFIMKTSVSGRYLLDLCLCVYFSYKVRKTISSCLNYSHNHFNPPKKPSPPPKKPPIKPSERKLQHHRSIPLDLHLSSSSNANKYWDILVNQMPFTWCNNSLVLLCWVKVVPCPTMHGT